jgi:hypothetical protein
MASIPRMRLCRSVQLAMARASPGDLWSRFVHRTLTYNTLRIFATYTPILLSSILSALLRVLHLVIHSTLLTALSRNHEFRSHLRCRGRWWRASRPRLCLPSGQRREERDFTGAAKLLQPSRKLGRYGANVSHDVSHSRIPNLEGTWRLIYVQVHRRLHGRHGSPVYGHVE